MVDIAFIWKHIYMYDEYFDNLDIAIETENYKEIINPYIDKYLI